MHSMHTYRMWTNKEGYALGRTQQERSIVLDVIKEEAIVVVDRVINHINGGMESL